MKKFGSDVMALPINPLRRKKPLPSATMGKMREREVEIPGAPFGKLSPRANIENENRAEHNKKIGIEILDGLFHPKMNWKGGKVSNKYPNAIPAKRLAPKSPLLLSEMM
ncbi:MAG: hypothetical protein CL999_003545 [Methanobacteriota archaeon]|jgi:hypothetical protein|nr:MAG: hypothetical protein CL999_003545 [Euryarchaeota archaeon]